MNIKHPINYKLFAMKKIDTVQQFLQFSAAAGLNDGK
jgi:hypothetical protein